MLCLTSIYPVCIVSLSSVGFPRMFSCTVVGILICLAVPLLALYFSFKYYAPFGAPCVVLGGIACNGSQGQQVGRGQVIYTTLFREQSRGTFNNMLNNGGALNGMTREGEDMAQLYGGRFSETNPLSY